MLWLKETKGTVPVKSASANISFYTNNSKMPNFELWHSCCKWTISYICVLQLILRSAVTLWIQPVNQQNWNEQNWITISNIFTFIIWNVLWFINTTVPYLQDTHCFVLLQYSIPFHPFHLLHYSPFSVLAPTQKTPQFLSVFLWSPPFSYSWDLQCFTYDDILPTWFWFSPLYSSSTAKYCMTHWD